jgi:hypothetical protein
MVYGFGLITTLGMIISGAQEYETPCKARDRVNELQLMNCMSRNRSCLDMHDAVVAEARFFYQSSNSMAMDHLSPAESRGAKPIFLAHNHNHSMHKHCSKRECFLFLLRGLAGTPCGTAHRHMGII